MDKLISPNQSTFLKEILFMKAYDSVSWIFFKYMMIKLSLIEKWRSWMKARVFVGNLAVLVNEFPTQEISIQRV